MGGICARVGTRLCPCHGPPKQLQTHAPAPARAASRVWSGASGEEGIGKGGGERAGGRGGGAS